MNGMKAMFDDMRGGGGMPVSEGAPPDTEDVGGEGMVCPKCGAKFVVEETEAAPEEAMPEGV